VKAWWSRFQNDEAFFRSQVTAGLRFAWSFGGAMIATWLDAPDWLKLLIATSGYLFRAGENNDELPKKPA
jgi:hypothetical protein